MENKNISIQLPMALRLDNTVITDKSSIAENFNKHFVMAGCAFHLVNPTLINSPLSSVAPRQNIPHFSIAHIQTLNILRELQHLDPLKSGGLNNLDPSFLLR